MTISVDGHGLTIEKVVRVARDREPDRHPSGSEKANPQVPGPARGQDPETRDHVRRQYGHRRAGRGRPDAGTGREVPAVHRLQPCRRASGGPLPGRSRSGGHAQPDQLSLPRPLRNAAHGDRDAGRHAQRRGHAGRLRKGLRRRLRRPRADVPDRPGPDGRRRGVLQGRAPSGRRSPKKGRDPAGRVRGPRRTGGHQRVQRHRRARGDRDIRCRPVAQALRDRGRHDARGPERQHEGLRPSRPRGPGLSRGAGVRREHPADLRGERASRPRAGRRSRTPTACAARLRSSAGPGTP